MMTSQKQILQNGEEKSMYSPQDFHVSPSAWLDSERERTMTATSGRRLSESFTKPSPLGLLARTLLESSRWFSPARRLKWEAVPLCSEKITEKEYCYGRNTSSKPSAVTLNEKVTRSSRLLFRLVPSEHPTDGTECGLLQEELLPTPQTQGLKVCNAEGKTEFIPLELLPSPVASDATTGAIIGKCDKFVATGNGTLRKVNRNGTNGSVGLARMVQLLPTPNAAEGEKYTTKYNPNSQMGKGLTAMAVNALLPTPQTRDYKGECHMTQSCLPNTFQTSQLNPLFVTEMMGFPLDWLVSPFQSGGPKPSKP